MQRSLPVEEMNIAGRGTFYIFPAGIWQVGFDIVDALHKGADEAALFLWDVASYFMKSVQWDS